MSGSVITLKTYSANRFGFSVLEDVISNKTPEMREYLKETMRVVKSACQLCESLGDCYDWKIIRSELTNEPAKSTIRLKTNKKCAKGEYILIDAAEFVRNPLSITGRCPENYSIPVIRTNFEGNNASFEEIGGCGRVLIDRNKEILLEKAAKNAARLSRHDFSWVSLPERSPSFLCLLNTYEDVGWISPEDAERLKTTKP
jgi:hypothetical protein